MKSHELARILLEGPDVVVRVAGYCSYMGEAKAVEYHDANANVKEPHVTIENNIPQI